MDTSDADYDSAVTMLDAQTLPRPPSPPLFAWPEGVVVTKVPPPPPLSRPFPARALPVPVTVAAPTQKIFHPMLAVKGVLHGTQPQPQPAPPVPAPPVSQPQVQPRVPIPENPPPQVQAVHPMLRKPTAPPASPTHVSLPGTVSPHPPQAVQVSPPRPRTAIKEESIEDSPENGSISESARDDDDDDNSEDKNKSEDRVDGDSVGSDSEVSEDDPGDYRLSFNSIVSKFLEVQRKDPRLTLDDLQHAVRKTIGAALPSTAKRSASVSRGPLLIRVPGEAAVEEPNDRDDGTIPVRESDSDPAEEAKWRANFESSQATRATPFSLEDVQVFDAHDRAGLLRVASRDDSVRGALWYHSRVRPVPFVDGVKLFDLQRLVTSWMTMRENSPPVSGITGGALNLEVGLGKTLTMLTHLFWRPRGARPTLAVVPKNVMEEWRKDLLTFFGDAFTHSHVLFLHTDFDPSSRKFKLADLEGRDLVITTFECAVSAWRSLDERGKSRAVVFSEDKVKNGKRCVAEIHVPQWKGYAEDARAVGYALIHGVCWERVVFDEAQRVANPKAIVFQACMGIAARFRWVLTGTLFRNYITDIWSQLRVLNYTGVEKASHWTANNAPVMYRKHKLASVIYKLTKKEAGIVLPALHDKTIYVTLNETEQTIYEAQETNANRVLDAVLGKMASMASMRVALLRMRQAAIAPHLMNAKGALDDMARDLEEQGEGRPGNRLKRARSDSDHSDSDSGRAVKHRRIKEEDGDEDEDDVESDSVSYSREKRKQSDSGSDSDSEAPPVKRRRRNEEDQEKAEAEAEAEAEDAVQKASQNSLYLYCKYPDGPGGIGATKICAGIETIRDFLLEAKENKILVFSFFTSLLDILELAFAKYMERSTWPTELADVRTTRIDGKTSAPSRRAMLDELRTKPNCRVCFAQSKVLGEGTNLQFCNSILMMEPYWTPQLEKQLIGRVYRSGQTREVSVFRIRSRTNIEERLDLMCAEKDKLDSNFDIRKRGGGALAKKGGEGLGLNAMRTLLAR